jgi:hypothetical protein
MRTNSAFHLLKLYCGKVYSAYPRSSPRLVLPLESKIKIECIHINIEKLLFILEHGFVALSTTPEPNRHPIVQWCF